MKIAKYKTTLSEERLPELVKEHTYNSKMDILDNAEKVTKFMKDVFQIHKETEEYVYEICFNSAMKPIAVFEVSHGTINQSILRPREFYQKALLVGAANVIAIHNHPSGDTTPSRQDIMISKRLEEAGEMIGIRLSDFIIIGDDYCSFRKDGRLSEGE